MVIAPPLDDLRYPPIRWQTVFVSTRPLVGKSVQKAECCGISATVLVQVSQFLPTRPRLFRNTKHKIAIRRANCHDRQATREASRRSRSAAVRAVLDCRPIQRAVKLARHMDGGSAP